MKSSKHTLIPFNLINIFLIVSTIIVSIITLTQGTVAGQVDTGSTDGWFYIITFTVESNILLGIVALIALISTLRVRKTKKPNKSLSTLYLVASTLTMLTALVVIFYLAPLRASTGKNYFDMLMGPMFFFHFFNPFLAALNFIFLTPSEEKLTLKSAFAPLIPLFLYGIFYFTGVILNLFPDFYQLTFGNQYYFIPLSVLVLVSLVFALANLLVYFYNRARNLTKTAPKKLKKS